MRQKSSGRIKPILALLVFAIALALLNSLNQQQLKQESGRDVLEPPALYSTEGLVGADLLFAEAFRKQKSNLQLSGTGKIIHILPGDNQGSRHQKFLVELEIGQTLLISHNIDVAPRIKNLREGEEIEFFGEYEWNEKGGVIHWTHHDPQGKHPDGWIKYKGRVYR